MVVHEAALSQSRDFKPMTVQWGLLSAQFHPFQSEAVQKWNSPSSNRSVKAEQVILMGFLVQQRPQNTRCLQFDSLQLQQRLFSVRQPCLKLLLSCICQSSSEQSSKPLIFPIGRVLRGLYRGSRGCPGPGEAEHEPASAVRCC